MLRVACLAAGSLFAVLGGAVASAAEDGRALQLASMPDRQPRSILFILTDDHRFDAMGHMGHPFLQTPHMDRMAAGGINFTSAYVTTSLCSPSRGSIWTGMYAHSHHIVDNYHPVPEGLVFLPQYLQAAGYETAYFGKWHMGYDFDDPRPGFDRWVSFKGQGHYFPHQDGLNVDGKKVAQTGYITDELTDYCVDWLNSRSGDRPFFICLSHKAAHWTFIPAKRHKGIYEDAEWTPPETMAPTEENLRGKPKWVKDQRNSWHGVDFMYHTKIPVETYHKRYCETLLAVDESLGRIMDALQAKGWLEEMLLVYMGDNGYCFGEHGLTDKRNAYEASMRVPLMAHCPGLIEGGQSIDDIVANIDIAPTFLEAAGLVPPAHMQGRSFYRLMQGDGSDWRDGLLYEHYWERNHPHTPTLHAYVTDRWKYIHYHGIWDTDELYDRKNDPLERHNLINSPEHQDVIGDLNSRMFAELKRTDGMTIPIRTDTTPVNNLRSPTGARVGDFPPWLYAD